MAGGPPLTATVEAACLRVLDGVVGIVVGIDVAQVRLPGGMDPLIGVAAGEREPRDGEYDGEPRGRFPRCWRRTFGRPAGELDHKVLLFAPAMFSMQLEWRPSRWTLPDWVAGAALGAVERGI
jgi:hypothetical protein